MKRPLFVFAGQSNMMGACVFEASEQIYFKNSFEYLHKPRRFGEDCGEFKTYGFPTGEFSYKDLSVAYGEGSDKNTKSNLANYQANTYFCPSMCNLKDKNEKSIYPFSHFCEADSRTAVSLPPFIVKGLEEKGISCAYTHIAKGGVPIKYYLEGGAAEYFDIKTTDFFKDCEQRFAGDDMSEKVLFWLQGESDANNSYDYYLSALEKLWERAEKLGFTKFFVVRVGFWGNMNASEIMRAQEDFCKTTENAFIITRASTFIEWARPTKEKLIENAGEEFSFCRDSFYGFLNDHINEKGFKIIAKYALPNIMRILFENKAPILEDEKVIALM